ncbi:unnamed protein product [Euphydryas editha]|uniref:Uncharacterized protein n=1 Tax=Euphydryas editha TaxID=104508 RepID=A0AAU9TYY7_EUPED|nr:unnamed protein product [Euphydryas editha]
MNCSCQMLTLRIEGINDRRKGEASKDGPRYCDHVEETRDSVETQSSGKELHLSKGWENHYVLVLHLSHMASNGLSRVTARRATRGSQIGLYEVQCIVEGNSDFRDLT